MVIGIIIGAVIWLLFELNKAVVKEDFSFKKFLKLNTLPAITNLVCGLVILWVKEDITDYFIVTKFSSILLGMAGQGIFKKISAIFNKNIDTHIGVNK